MNIMLLYCDLHYFLTIETLHVTNHSHSQLNSALYENYLYFENKESSFIVLVAICSISSAVKKYFWWFSVLRVGLLH